jgi:deoxyhypusine synthase
MAKKQSKFLGGRRIDPGADHFRNEAGRSGRQRVRRLQRRRLREACWLFNQKMLEPDVTVGVTITGAMTPAGLGMSALIPLIRAGFIDWIISTGANFYHDTHFGIGLAMHEGNAQTSDIVLRAEEVVRIYDIFFDYSVLLNTDDFFRRVIEAPEFQKADVHGRISLPRRPLCARARAQTWLEE